MWRAWLLLLALGYVVAQPPPSETDLSDVLNAVSEPGVQNYTDDEFYLGVHYEWESYDGWYHNPSHPEWGGADMPLERKTPIAYPDGVYETAGGDRPNVLLISNLTQNGFTGRGSMTRTGFFIFFGQQVVEEVLDAQRPGCIPEYFDMLVPKCHPLFDPDCRGDLYIPFLRNRYDFNTGYAPNNPRMQLNEITPWMDGGLMYGPFKAWTDVIRRFQGGELASMNNEEALSEQFPQSNQEIGLPFANPPPPANNSLFPVNRFFTIGNPRGNENPFLFTMGVLWFRVHNWWARRLRQFYQLNMDREEFEAEWRNDEWLFNRARMFTIATYQHIVYNEWLPIFLQSKFGPNGATTAEAYPYASNPGYSAYFGRTGYNPAINPQVAHIFQSAAMRFGHTMVTPGVWRRLGGGGTGEPCRFGNTLSPDFANSTNAFLQSLSPGIQINTIDELWLATCDPDGALYRVHDALTSILCNGSNPMYNPNIDDGYEPLGELFFAPRTCNQYWNPTVTTSETNVDAFFLGMASQQCEREDFIITEDLRGFVFGPLDYTRRDLMAINLQRARDHGLPDFNSARVAYGLNPLYSFEDLNPQYGIDPEITDNIERLRDVYNNDISKCDIWACGLAETTEDNGPGPLFTEVLFDQFMRIRHADRFWYENYEFNHMFTEEEFNMITELTIKEILIAITVNITTGNIQENPFLVTTGNIDYCPQPFQLSELYMDDCSPLENFEYYDTSVWQIPFIWGLTFLYVGIVIMVMLAIAAYNQHRRAQILSTYRKRSPQQIAGDDLTDNEGEVLVAWEEKAGLEETTRMVSIKLGPEKVLKLFYGEDLLRTIDLRPHSEITIQRPFDNDHYFIIKLENEYDVLLRCKTALDRAVFIEKIQNYLDPHGIRVKLEEPQAKIAKKQVLTKKMRQRLLENFFKSVFQEAGSAHYETRKDILNCELTRDEFADAMSMKADSIFVEQMFKLIDVDGNGFVSFREFADMTVIFSKGSPDEKLELMFRMYDVDASGLLDREEFKKMLKSMMELVNANVSPDQMDSLVESMFAAAGFQSKEQLTVQDFKVLMRDHKEELSNAKLNVAGVEAPSIEPTKKEEVEESSLPQRFQARESATSRARHTVRAYGRAKPGSAAPAKDTESSVTITTKKRTMTSTPLGRYISVFVRWVENYKLHIFYLTLFQLVTACIFIERAYFYSVEREHAGLRRIAGYGVTITRGAASGMMWCYSVLLITMAKNFITYLRETIFNYYVPFDTYISFHKIVALTGGFYTFMHMIGHGINFYHIATQTSGDLTCIFRNVYYRSHFLPKFSYWLFLTMTGFSGFVLTLVTIVIYVFAVQYARRYAFTAFWFTHHWYIVFYIMMFLHGSGRLVQDPLFGNFFMGPAIVYAIDRLITLGRRRVEVAIVRADILPSQVVGIYFKRPPNFEYRAGQWVSIASLAQNPGEYHPFTLTSAPHEENLSLHIRAVGPWTHNLRESIQTCNKQAVPYPKLYVDGPFGEGHQDWFRFEVSILVGGGIGVTPFASILKEIVNRFNIGARIQSKKVYFIWVTRTQKQFEWLTDIIREVENADNRNLVDVHIFVTQFFDKFDLRTAMLYVAERHFQRLSGRSLFTGLKAITHFGRPDFNSFFDSLQLEHALLSRIGVFSCGPPGMTNGVEDACAATNRYEGPAFVHHFENF